MKGFLVCQRPGTFLTGGINVWTLRRCCSEINFSLLSLLHKIDNIKMAGTSREISNVMTSAANNYNTRLDSSVRIKTYIRTEVTENRIRANAHNSENYETRDNARRTDRASDLSGLRLTYALTTPWLPSPASSVARRAITLIVRLGT